MARIFYILIIIFLAGWLLRIAFPYIFKFFLWLLNRKMEKEMEHKKNYSEQTVEYKAKETQDTNEDDDFIEYEEVD